MINIFPLSRAMIELKGFYSLEKPGDFHNLVDVQVFVWKYVNKNYRD